MIPHEKTKELSADDEPAIIPYMVVDMYDILSYSFIWYIIIVSLTSDFLCVSYKIKFYD